MIRIPFGAKVKVKASLIRMHGPNNTRFWKKFQDEDYEAIFLGYRTLYDGEIESDFDENGSWQIFVGKQTHKGALVCREKRNPEKVFLADIIYEPSPSQN